MILKFLYIAVRKCYVYHGIVTITKLLIRISFFGAAQPHSVKSQSDFIYMNRLEFSKLRHI